MPRNLLEGIEIKRKPRNLLEGIIERPTLKEETKSIISNKQEPIQEKSISGFISNIPKSAVETGKSIISPILNPIDTISGLEDLAIGIVGKAIGSKNTDEYEKNVDSVTSYFKKRYGGLDNLKETAYNDPVGFAQDLSTILTIGGNSLSKIGQLSKAKNIAKIGSLPKPTLVSKTIENIKKVGEYTSPSNLTIKGIGKTIEKGGKLASKGSTYLAEREIQSLIRPPMKQWTYGKNPVKGVLEEGIVATSLDDLTNKISQKKNIVGKMIDKQILKPKNMDKKIDLSNITKAIDESIQQASSMPSVNQPLIKRLIDIKTDLLNKPINYKQTPVMVAQRLKQDLGSITKYTGSINDDKLVNSTLKKTYHFIDSKIDKSVPGIKKINERYANLLGAEISSKNRLQVQNRNNILGWTDVIVGGLSYTASKDPIKTALTIGAVKALGSTPSKTITSKLLYKGIAPSAKNISQIGKKIDILSPTIGNISKTTYQIDKTNKKQPQ